LYITLHLSVSSVVWVPMGISIALVYLWGYRYLPVFTTLSLIAAIFYGLPVLPSLPPIIASTLTCYLAVLLLKQKLKINPALTSLRDVMVLLLVGLLMPLIPSAISTTSFLSAGLIDTSGLLNLWLEWWAIDLLGILLIVPLVLVWHSNLKGKSNYIIKRWDWLILILVVFLTWWIFRQEIGTPIYFGSLTYLIYPFLFWIALRLYQPGITLANLCICLMALFTVIEGSTFGTKTLIQSMIMLEVFMLALTITSLILASLFTERKETNLRLQEFNLNLEDRINQRTREFKSLNSQLKQELRSKHNMEKELRVSQENLRTVIDNMSDAMVLIDTEGKVVDLNENVLSLFRVNREKALHEFNLSEFSAPKKNQKELSKYFFRAMEGENVSFDWEARRPTDNSTFDVEVSMKRIRLNNQQLVVISIRDLSERKRVEAAEHEQRVLAEALKNTAGALSSTLELDEVFDRILKNVGKVVPHDAVNLMLIENGIARIVHSHGYQKLGMLNYIRNIRFEVDKIPNLRSMIESGNPIIIPDVSKSPDWVLPVGIKWIQSYAGAPIRIRGTVIGFLQLDSGTPDFFKKEHSERLQAFADQAAVAIENARLYGELQKLAITDPLTGLLNRHGFNPPAKREFEIARRYNRKMSMIFFDIDHLKNINDRHGHPSGDKALQMIADCCRSTLREIDLIGRYGGDEFIVLIPETGLEDAIDIARRLKNCVNASPIDHSDGKIPVSTSMGVAELNKDVGSLEELIDYADRGSYLAKSQGRDSIATVQSVREQIRH
ncbi:MAG: diguanylate cyclase, partial [Anaerolineaceae bacterium]